MYRSCYVTPHVTEVLCAHKRVIFDISWAHMAAHSLKSASDSESPSVNPFHHAEFIFGCKLLFLMPNSPARSSWRGMTTFLRQFRKQRTSMPRWSVSSQVPPASCAFWLRGSNVSLVLSRCLSPPGASCARGLLTVTQFTESWGFFRTRLSSLFVELVKFLTPNIFDCHSFKIHHRCSQQMLLLLLWLLEMEFWVHRQLLNGKVCLWPPFQSIMHPFFYALFCFGSRWDIVILWEVHFFAFLLKSLMTVRGNFLVLSHW